MQVGEQDGEASRSPLQMISGCLWPARCYSDTSALCPAIKSYLWRPPPSTPQGVESSRVTECLWAQKWRVGDWEAQDTTIHASVSAQKEGDTSLVRLFFLFLLSFTLKLVPDMNSSKGSPPRHHDFWVQMNGLRLTPSPSGLLHLLELKTFSPSQSVVSHLPKTMFSIRRVSRARRPQQQYASGKGRQGSRPWDLNSRISPPYSSCVVHLSPGVRQDHQAEYILFCDRTYPQFLEWRLATGLLDMELVREQSLNSKSSRASASSLIPLCKELPSICLIIISQSRNRECCNNNFIFPA